MKFDISQITEMLNKLDIKFRYAIFIGILATILLADLFIIILPLQINNIQKIIADTQSLQESVERLRSDTTRIDQMKAGLTKNKNELEVMNSRIRQVGEIPSIMEDMSNLANQAGVKIDQLTPQTDAQKSLVSNEIIKYYSLPIVMQASSGYHMFGRFLNKLELGKLYFIVNSLSIEDKGDDLKRHLINANFKVILYEKNIDGQQK